MGGRSGRGVLPDVTVQLTKTDGFKITEGSSKITKGTGKKNEDTGKITKGTEKKTREPAK